MAQTWKKIDPTNLDQLRDVDLPTDKPFSTSADHILPGISAERVIREIKGMLVGDEYLYAEGTLRGILQTIEKTETVTQGQWDAIEHIMDAPRREGRTRRSRRF
jgi:hypothetical protein